MSLVDFDTLLLAQTQLHLGGKVTLTPVDGFPHTISAIDRSAGVAVGDPNGVELDTIKPAAVIRATDLAGAGLVTLDLDGAALTMNGKTWRVESWRALPGPAGEGTGEIMLFLIEGDL